MSLKKRLVRGGASMLALRIYSMILMLALNGCLARWMSKEQFASYLVGSNLIILISLIGMTGINQSMIRIVAGKSDRDVSSANLIRRCIMTAGGFSIVVTVVFAVLLRTSLGSWLECDPQIVIAVLVCSLLVSAHKLLATSLRSVHAIAASSVLEGRSGGPLANTAFFPIVAIFAFGLLNAPRTFYAFAIALAITLPVGIGFLRHAIRNSLHNPDGNSRNAEDGVEVQSVFLFSVPFLFSQVLTYFATEFDVLLAQAYTDPDSTAIFGSSRRLVLQLLAPMQIITASVASSIAQLYAARDRDGLQKMLRYSATLGFAVTAPTLLLGAYFAGPILAIVFGEAYRSGSSIFAIFAVGQIAMAFTGQCGNLLSLSGRMKYLLIQKTTFAIALVIIGSWAAKQHGIVGLAVATTVVIGTQNIVMWAAARYLVGYWTHPNLLFRKPIVADNDSAMEKDSSHR